MSDYILETKNLVKEFDLRHTRSIKEYMVWWATGRRGQLSDNFNALDDVSFTITQGESVALLGFNICVTAIRHGRPQGDYDVRAALAGAALTVFLLVCGGFFG